MAILHEHAENIRAAIQAAELDGYKVDLEVYRDRRDSSEIDSIDIELHQYRTNGEGGRYVSAYETLHEWESE